MGGLSGPTLVIHLVTGFLFCMYGLLLNELPIVVANIVYFVCTCIIAAAFCKFGKGASSVTSFQEETQTVSPAI